MKIILIGDRDTGISTFIYDCASTLIKSTTITSDGDTKHSSREGILISESIGTMIGQKKGKYYGRDIKFDIWSMTKSKRGKIEINDALALSLLHGSSGILFFYDITEIKTIRNLSKWSRLIVDKNNLSNLITIIFLGNKIDLIQNQIEVRITNEVDHLISETKENFKIPVHSLNISVVEKTNIDQIFNILTKDYFNYLETVKTKK